MKVSPDAYGKAEEAEAIRNQLVHSLWTSGPRFKRDLHQHKGLTTKTEDYTVDELRAIAGWIDRIDTSVDAFAFRYIDEAESKGVGRIAAPYNFLVCFRQRRARAKLSRSVAFSQAFMGCLRDIRSDSPPSTLFETTSNPEEHAWALARGIAMREKPVGELNRF